MTCFIGPSNIFVYVCVCHIFGSEFLSQGVDFVFIGKILAVRPKQEFYFIYFLYLFIGIFRLFLMFLLNILCQLWCKSMQIKPNDIQKYAMRQRGSLQDYQYILVPYQYIFKKYTSGFVKSSLIAAKFCNIDFIGCIR